VAYSEVE